VDALLRISNVRFVAAPARLARSGLLGWTTVALNDGIDLGYIAVRRTLDGRVVLAFPERRDGSGFAHPIVRPLDQATRDAITEQVVAELRRQGVLP
jgi:DNA-binding cell septation regulator SpoVG